MKKIVFAFFFTVLSLNLYSQQLSEKQEALGTFIKHMYANNPFQGVRIIRDSATNYLISVVVYQIDAFEDEYILKRTATLQARSDAHHFVGDTAIASETIVNTAENADMDSVKTRSEMAVYLKNIKERWALWMDLLTSFDVSEGKQRVFVFINTFSDK